MHAVANRLGQLLFILLLCLILIRTVAREVKLASVPLCLCGCLSFKKREEPQRHRDTEAAFHNSSVTADVSGGLMRFSFCCRGHPPACGQARQVEPASVCYVSPW